MTNEIPVSALVALQRQWRTAANGEELMPLSTEEDIRLGRIAIPNI